MTTALIQIISGCIGTVGFGVLFNIRGKKLLFGGIGGFLSWTLYVVFSLFISSEPFVYTLVSIATSIYAEILAVKLKTPTTTFLIISLIPLIPGGSLYYTMAYALGGNLSDFISKAVSTLELAAALSVGIILVLSVAKHIRIAKQPYK
jgi:uncharacterized membrane protein YjjB (DUF3815 family)